MANVRNGNTFFIDTVAADTDPGTDENLAIKNIKVKAIFITATAATAILELKDVTTGAVKFNLREASTGETDYFDLTNLNVVFPNGISPSTVTNMQATLIIQETRG